MLASISLDNLLDAFPKEFVHISSQEQDLAIALYRLLALNEPVTHQQLAEVTKIPLPNVNRYLGQWLGVIHDDTNRIIGFWGLGLTATTHKIVTDEHEFYAWCAWDTLFLPVLIGKTLQVSSRCAISGADIKLTINTERIESLQPGATVLSFVQPNAQGIRTDIVSNFCHSVLYFASAALGEQWVAQHPGSFLLSVEEAFNLAKKLNARKFPDLRTI
ncbi:MAG: organomercurial lyase [Thiohalomonadales bacterium]